MILIDTHILLWLEGDVTKLSDSLLIEINNSEIIYISSFSVWEIYLKVKQGKLKLTINFDDWINNIQTRNLYKFINPNLEILRKSIDLNWEHRDPADRIIVATGLVENLKLATHDKKIINSNLIEVVN